MKLQTFLKLVWHFLIGVVFRVCKHRFLNDTGVCFSELIRRCEFHIRNDSAYLKCM